jgi:arylsulfatase A-like enzyme
MVAESKHQRQGGEGFWRGGPVAPGFKHVDVLPRLEQETIAYIKERGASQKGEREKNAKVTPFFLYLPLTAPHTPWLPTAEFAGKSAVGAYGDFTEQTDATIGAILAALEALGLKENTIVVLTSDNGSHWLADDIAKWNHRANHIYRGQKADIHEAGHRVPFVVRWPGKIAAGTSSNQTACLTDFFATMAEITGAALPNDAAEDSFSLLPVFKDPAAGKSARDTTVHHSGDGLFAIRVGDWKLIDGLGSGGFTAPKNVKAKAGEATGQLYNLKDDPSEQKNHFAEKSEVVESLSQKLKALKNNGRSRQ